VKSILHELLRRAPKCQNAAVRTVGVCSFFYSAKPWTFVETATVTNPLDIYQSTSSRVLYVAWPRPFWQYIFSIKNSTKCFTKYILWIEKYREKLMSYRELSNNMPSVITYVVRRISRTSSIQSVNYANGKLGTKSLRKKLEKSPAVQFYAV
jgi:hypothetical protein